MLCHLGRHVEVGHEIVRFLLHLELDDLFLDK
jgi:hypothetical protein